MHHSPKNKAAPPERVSPALWAGVLVLTLAIFGTVALAITFYLRADIRDRIVNRDGETFTAVAQMMLEEVAVNDEPEPADIFTTALQTSKLSGVLAVRLHEPDGFFIDSVPFDARERPLSEENLETLRELRPLSFYEPEGNLSSVLDFHIPEEVPALTPLLHVAIPLQNPKNRELAGIAYYTIDGSPIAGEFQELDRSLALHAGTVFGLGGILFVLVAGSAWWHINRAHRLLRKRTRSLIKANQELSLAAKTSAVGAVTAHLIHGLKNPLAGLNQLVSAAGAGGSDGTVVEKEDWLAAVESTRRMQSMIDEIVGVIQEEDGAATYEVTPKELVDMLDAKIAPRAESSGIVFEKSLADGNNIVFPGREANLIVLILVNLLDNAITASSAGGRVRMELKTEGDGVRFEIHDQGSGISPEIREHLFTPNKIGRNGGCGLGLAISYRLARHMGANLELTKSDETGTRFTLSLPER